MSTRSVLVPFANVWTSASNDSFILTSSVIVPCRLMIPCGHVDLASLVLICHSGLGTENTVSQRIQTDNHKIGKMVLY